MTGSYHPVVADNLLAWGFMVVGVLAVAGFFWANIKGQRNLDKMQQPPDARTRLGPTARCRRQRWFRLIAQSSSHEHDQQAVIFDRDA